jgi:hypothetical protein
MSHRRISSAESFDPTPSSTPFLLPCPPNEWQIFVKLSPQLFYQRRFLLSEVRFLATFPDFLENPRLRAIHVQSPGLQRMRLPQFQRA